MPSRPSQMSLKALFVFKSDRLALQLCAFDALELRGCLVHFLRRLGCLFLGSAFIFRSTYGTPPWVLPSVLPWRLPWLKPPVGNIQTP